MELAQYLAPLRKWWWLILASAMLAAVSSFYVVRQQPSVYRAIATLMVGQPFENPNPAGGELFLGQQLASTYADIAMRDPIRIKTSAALGLDQLPGYLVLPLPQSQLLEIQVTSTSPELAQLVANEIANQLILQSPTAPKPEEQEREAFINDQLNSLQLNIKETEAEINEKENELNNAFSAREIADLEQEINGLQSKLATLQGNYTSLLSNTQSGAVNTLTLIEPAGLPIVPIGPAKASTILAATAAALGLAAGTAYLLEYLDDTIKDTKDIEHISGLPALPGIPEIKNGDNLSSLVTIEQPRGPAADAFRALRGTVQNKIKDKSTGLLLITSSKPQEGKSFVAANLSIVLAQAGYNTLLVDADVNRPMQHKLFDLPNTVGLADVLVHHTRNVRDSDLWIPLEEVVQPSNQMELSILLSGSRESRATLILNSDNTRGLFSTVAAHYDYIIVDSPPLLATSDALTLSTIVESVILVTSVGKTRRRDFRQAIKQLRDVDAGLIGVVINRLKISSEYYYYRYHQYYSKSNTSPHVEDQVESLGYQNGSKKKLRKSQNA